MEYTQQTEMIPQEQAHAHTDEAQRSVFELVIDRLVHKRKLLIRTLILALIASTAIAFLIPKKYESTVRIMPPEGQNPAALLAAVTGKLPAGLGDLAGGLLGTKNAGPLYLDLLKSRTILDNQVSKFELQKVYWTRYRYRARRKLLSRTKAAEDRKSGVITITVSDTDPGRAKALAEGYVKELDELLAKVSTSAARRERMFIEKRLETAKVDLENAEVEFGRFASKNSTLDVKEQTKAMVTAGAELQGRIIAAESELQGLEQTYSENNVRVRSMRARIAEMRRQLNKLGGVGAGDVQASLAPGDMYPSIRQLPILGVQWADLYRRAKIQETIFELLTQQYELAKVQEAREIPTVRVVDPADYPERKSWPPRLLIVIAGTVLGLAAFVAWEWFSIKRISFDDTQWFKTLRSVRRLFSRRSIFDIQEDGRANG